MESDIAMRASDRGLIVGANGTGKSTLAEYVLSQFRDNYPDARIMVMDTKPRWRAEKLADGTNPRRYYRQLGKGDTIPGSVSLTRMIDWPAVWDRDLNPTQSVIVQRLTGTMEQNLRFQVAALEKFFATQRASRPSFVYLDEMMDFFNAQSGARGGSDIVRRCYRAGREKGLATLGGVQRPVGIDIMTKTEVNWVALFRINAVKDIKEMYDIGWPQSTGPPTYEQPHCFRLWREGSPTAPLYRLKQKGKRNESSGARVAS